MRCIGLHDLSTAHVRVCNTRHSCRKLGYCILRVAAFVASSKSFFCTNAIMTKGDSSSTCSENQLYQSKEYEELSPSLKAKVRANSQPDRLGFKTKLVWTNIYYMVVLHVLALCGLLAGALAKWQSWALYAFLLTSSCFGVTAGAHRLWTHRSYKATLPFKIVLMLFDCIAMQNSILVWARDHRLHHKYSETDADPHNANRGFFFAHVGWLLMLKHPQVLIKGQNIDVSDLKQDPVVMFQERHYHILIFLFCVFLPILVPWYFWNESLMVSFLFVFACRYVMSLHCTWLVNSVAHLWGNRPYDQQTNPADNSFVCYAAFGEGFHNYHHTFPFDYSTGEWGPKLNFTTCVIDICAAFGLVYDRKQISQEAIMNVRKRKGNLAE